ncbi:MAG: Eco57I restriction-modification methylase domain-containing protein [Stygiobacter sp.]
MNFQNPYSRADYKKFFQNSFLTDSFKIIEEEISLEFKPQYIKKAELIGRDKSLELEVYEIQHESEYDPRVGLSKDFFRLMANYGSKRALAIFYSPKSKNYRLSLATVDLSLEGSKVRREYSNPKRFSFFLGPDAKVHTPYDFLIKKGKVKDFEDLQSRFSIEVVNKEFYKEIANWYFWALKNVKFPDDAEAEKNGREISAIRLITRLIFIWFMKVRKLVPEVLFNESALKDILTDLKPKDDNYYKAILQNLFFATLNTKQDERRFTSKKKGYKGFSQDFGNHNVYRYEELFKNSEEVIEKYFMPIPFLNGGLFECLDYKTKTRDERKYIDGFTSTKSQQPSVPNSLFFSEDKAIDLNKDYGTTNKKYNVRGLINTLSLYNFTIDESDPNDADVALDPELLGKVFENLLASYNPETAKTARKSTGSYYTPRPIVDYMVDESLKEYFKTHLYSADSIPAVGSVRKNTKSILAVGNNTDNITDIDTDNDYNFFNPYDEIDIHRGNLPHWQQKDVWYFVTFRLADSLPREIVEHIKKERELWLEQHQKEENKPYSVEELKEYYRLFSERIENILDDCKGSCLLREEKIAKIVADALLFFQNKKYVLDDWVIMPNHLHILVKPINGHTLPEITHSWKSFTANEINKLTGKSGQLWLHESYDHIVRNEAAFYAIKNYIRNNSIKANLKLPNCAQSWTYEQYTSRSEDNSAFESKDALNTLLDTLFSDEPNPFDEETTKKLVNLIDSLRVVDPAVGSGAFPMRILNRLVFLLHKLDPDNSLWKQSQIDGIKKSVKDITLQRKFIEETERKFKEKNPDYGRKLYLIEKCIYGVDIQQIAVEIAKLRFFISLLVDEKVENGEIEPLPNLDFKLMQGNSLISSFAGIDFSTKPKNDDNLFDFDEKYRQLIDEFEELKSQYQNEPDVHKKRKLRDEIDAKLLEIFDEKLKQHYPQLQELESKYTGRKEIIEAEKKKIFKKIGIDIDQAQQDLIAYTEGRKQKDFFLWDVYFAEVFAEKGGFDIVIGNPPYGNNLNTSEILVLEEKFSKYKFPNKNSAIYFIFIADTILKNQGINSFIVPKSLSYSQGWDVCARFLLSNLFGFYDAGKSFDNVLLEMVVFLKKKGAFFYEYTTGFFDNEKFRIYGLINKRVYHNYKILLTAQSKEEIDLLLKILNNNTSYWGNYVSIERGLNWQSKVESNKGNTPIFRGAQLNKYYLENASDYISLSNFNKTDYLYQMKPKILNQLAIAHVKNPYPHFYLQAYLDLDNKLVFETISCTFSKSDNINLFFLLALNNSKLFAWLLYKFVYNNAIRSTRYDEQYVSKIPCPYFNYVNQKPFIYSAKKILTSKKQNPSADTKHLENQIDIMVYKLYNLTYEEVEIIDPQIGKIISKEEYEKFEIK